MARGGRGRRNDDGPRNGSRRDFGRRASPPRYRDNYDDRRNDRNGSDNWRPINRPRSPQRFGGRNGDRGGDSYRPQVPQGDFTFRVDKPSGISNEPVNPFPPRGPRNHNGRRDARGRGRGGRGGRWMPPHPSERALLTGAKLKPVEARIGDENGTAKFRNVDEMSDDEELEMDTHSEGDTTSSSGSDSEEDGDQPSRKRARVAEPEEKAKEVEAPKWSNPDPYTALPCPDDTQKKKRDVVSLIRKARLEEQEAKPAATTEAENFISFDSTEDEEEEEEEEEEPQPTSSRRPSPPYEPQPPLPPGPPPSAPAGPRNGTLTRFGPDENLGSRKRTADDEIKPPEYQLNKPGSKSVHGYVQTPWLPKKNEDPTPWAVDHSGTADMAFRLHKEVIDFYEYVRPRPFEHRIRSTLIENLKMAMRRDARSFSDATVHPFGSYMSGLYLPTADMDLVICSPPYLRGGPPKYLSAKSWLYKFRKFLESQRVADSDTIQVIAHAKVPLVKYVDKMTGLRVDVSFDSLGGVDAVEVFREWKARYPSMPILVTLVKHFLQMRGLNEPVNGGLGGFSVICLVVSMLQVHPGVQAGDLIPEHHLGEMVMEFMELYGRRFGYDKVAIKLTDRPGYVKKSKVHSLIYRNTDRFSIIDPLNENNDISGGSSNSSTIVARFEDAYYNLQKRMSEVGSGKADGGILDCLMKGDYSSFRKQREYLRVVHERIIGPVDPYERHTD